MIGADGERDDKKRCACRAWIRTPSPWPSPLEIDQTVGHHNQSVVHRSWRLHNRDELPGVAMDFEARALARLEQDSGIVTKLKRTG